MQEAIALAILMVCITVGWVVGCVLGEIVARLRS